MGSLVNDAGVTVFEGEIIGAGGAGAAVINDFVFTEVATAGTYTATLVIPAGGWLLDAFLIPETPLWASPGAAINVGPTGDPAGIFNNQGLDGSGTNGAYNPYLNTPTVVNDYLNMQTSASSTVYLYTMWSARDATHNGDGTAPGVPFPAGTTITAVAVTNHVGVVVPTGIMRVRLIYTVPAVSAATFA